MQHPVGPPGGGGGTYEKNNLGIEEEDSDIDTRG